MQIKFNDFIKESEVRGVEYKKAFDRVLKSGWYILGNEVRLFEEEFSRFLGVKYCIGVGNGLEALQISLMSLGIGKGDEVITAPVSAVATTLAILAVGAKPVFVDVNCNGQIDASKIEEKITSKTKAIIPVHLYGQPCEIDLIEKICKENDLFLVEDAAQAHGATYKGKKVSTYGDISGFSFYPTKNLGAIGDGGAIVTNNEDLAESCRQIRDYGQKSKYVHTVYGLNSRLDELQAALLRVKLLHLDKDNEKRKKIASEYCKNLSDIRNLSIVLPENINDSVFHIFAITTEERDQLKSYLESKGIPALIHYPISIPDQPFLKNDYSKSSISNARKFVKEQLSLPIHPFLTLKEVKDISITVKKFFNK